MHVASECYAKSSLKLNCDWNDHSRSDVISIQWSATFLGRSRSHCGNSKGCCPNATDCTVLLMDYDKFWKSNHSKELTACNGQPSCKVPVSMSAPCGGTNYENVTYQCVQPLGSSPYVTSALVGKDHSEHTTTHSATGTVHVLHDRRVS